MSIFKQIVVLNTWSYAKYLTKLEIRWKCMICDRIERENIYKTYYSETILATLERCLDFKWSKHNGLSSMHLKQF